MDKALDYVKKIGLIIGFVGGVFVAYKAGEKSERSRYEGYTQGREDFKRESSATIHDLGRMIDREIAIRRAFEDKKGVKKTEHEINKIILERPTMTRFTIREALESTENLTQRTAKMVGLIDQVKSLFVRGNIDKDQALDCIGEINAQLIEVEKQAPMNGELGELKKMIEEEIKTARKYINEY